MPSSIKSAKVSILVDQVSEEQFVDVPLDIDAEFGGKEARLKLEWKLLRKLDMRMSILIVIYILNYVRLNLRSDHAQIAFSAARLKGFEADLHLKGQQFNTILSILYVGYILMQIPSNMFLNHIGRPSIYLSICMMIWGAISCLTGATHNYIGALLTRFFLGFVEAAFFPGALFLLSKCLISNAFGSLMASSILSGMQGKMGHAALEVCRSSWLFYIEGALTILLRMLEDVGVSDGEETERKGSRFPGFFEALSDWKVYWPSRCRSMRSSLTLTATLGYSSTVTLLLCAPPWIFASIVAFAVSRHSDRTGERFFHIVVPLLIGIIGFIIALSTMRLAARYFALFLMAQSYAGFICFLTWTSNTFSRSASKRAFSQLGNIAGSYVWQKSWGPTYSRSYAICISTNGLCIVMCFIFRQMLAKQNKQMEESSAGQRKKYRYIL
ncbi:MFS general substrate transporter [Lactarius sanguifluus]|nr:MFS general substrate transporter [Lactarius sanguifluus]